ncbi:jasmonoyl--L-amino acid synthetase JAR6-like [Salvia splendens]|uniref:jasmonoyl--L-amino acid synthetase JAR6-like n=1 Tax=Salvia splendens TaxID=180675 RepID=UPI001C27D024|nr:jasmonoyl--L-amino acid synthetase JAR6-like [Salvia splendens]
MRLPPVDGIGDHNLENAPFFDLQLAVEAAAELLATEKLEVVDFTSRMDLSTDPGHYVVFWEISGEAQDELLQECCNCLDRSFVDAGYMSSRKARAIGALELRIVRKGDTGPLHRARGSRQPVQDATLCGPHERHRAADLVRECRRELLQHCV